METSTIKRHILTPEQKEEFIGMLLIDRLMNVTGQFLPIMMEGDNKYLEPICIKLTAKNYLKVEGKYYVPTDLAMSALKKFMQRYSEYLKTFDIFCAVDLNTGEFAFDKFFDFETDEEWENYLNDERWEDCRVAVAEYKKMNALEIIFISFLNEEKFDFKKTGWQFDIISGLIWDELEGICNSNLSMEQINQGDDTVMPDLFQKGIERNIINMKREEEIRQAEIDYQNQQNDLQQNNTEVVTETVEEVIIEENEYSPDYYVYPVSYYEAYYDPFYISPIWVGALLIL